MLSIAACLAGLGWGSAIEAQAPTASVRGIAFDSLRGQPLKNAVVLVVGTRETATTDDRGRFRLDSVPTGTQTLVIHHAFLDSVGLPGISRRLTVRDGGDQVSLTVPSFETLWRAACGGDAPKDTGFVFGTIRDAMRREPVPNVALTVSWTETHVSVLEGVRQKRVAGGARTNEHGVYAICGIPVTNWVRIEARSDSSRTGSLSLPPTELPVQRRDLLLGHAQVDSALLGRVTGLLTDQNAQAFSTARVVLDDSIEVRSDGDGRFAFFGVLPGTRQLEVFAIGMMPIVTAVDVWPGDSTTLAFQLRTVTVLDVVRVTAPTNRARLIAQGIEERRKSGLGYTMDMTELGSYPSFASALNDLPGARTEYRRGNYAMWVPDGRGGQCQPEVWIDGHHMTMSSLMTIMPKDVTAIELYVRASAVPMQFRPPERLATCGALLIWTNWAFSR